MKKKSPTPVQKKIKDPVSEMKIYRESLKKQHDHLHVYEHFMINDPQKVDFYTQKPNNNPFLLMKYKNEGRKINGVDIDEVLDDETKKSDLTTQMNDKLKTLTHAPKDKWVQPQTANQQIGWYADRLNSDGKFVYRRLSCPETTYADSYYTMKHFSLFSNKQQKK